MDQDTTKGSDKRNWRERLGIGTGGQTGKELPRISDDFRKDDPAAGSSAAPKAAAAARPAARAAAPVKPAPMAPRATPKAAPVPADKLAERLRAQRDASARLAEQRVQVAKHRGEQPAQPLPPVATRPAAGPGETKPKFTFAEDDQGAAAGKRPAAPPPAAAKPVQTVAPPQPPKVAAPPPPAPPPLTPARPPLGVGATPQRPVSPAGFGTPGSYVPQVQPPPPVNPGYGAGAPGYAPQTPFPPYRPIDPATGYTAGPAAGAPPPPMRPYQPQSYGAPQPRLNMPASPGAAPGGFSAGYQQQDYSSGSGYAPDPRLNQPRLNRAPARPAPPPTFDDGGDNELFEETVPRGRRPSSVDYQQAYREAEAGYEDEPRSRGPWILLGLLLFSSIVAFGIVWYYLTIVKPMMNANGSSTQGAPVVEAPAQPAKAQPDQTQSESAAGQANRKQIYDRIVGDREVPGGTLVPTEEAPAAPGDGTSAIPQPTGDSGQGTGVDGGGEEAAPLPIPPPPANSDQQGALPSDKSDQEMQTASTAAGESPAAVSAPAPGEPVPTASTPDDSTNAAAPSEDATVVTPKPVKKPAVKTAAVKKPAQNLGAKPVVLVPPAKPAKVAATDTQVASIDPPAGGGGLYGADTVTTPAAPATQTTAPKKKRTLADLFNGTKDDTAAADTGEVLNVEPAPAAPAPRKAVQAPAAVPPAPQQQASTGGGGYMVQLASFQSKQEANSEYARLKAKHGATFSGYGPIISEATVGGSTRYRLSIGTMASRDQASAMCSKLFAAGERDCLVRSR